VLLPGVCSGLTLSKVGGLTVPREIEGRLLPASLFLAGLGRRRRVNISRERERMERGLFKNTVDDLLLFSYGDKRSAYAFSFKAVNLFMAIQQERPLGR